MTGPRPSAGIVQVAYREVAGGWGSNPRPADYEKYGSVHRAHYLHGHRGACHR
jgi:hypothetical protein